ncbi:acyl-CoA thioesterase [bacterium]|nr:acyl-CoA thioesterase [bacterium]
MIKSQSKICVRYAETDKMGIAHHSHYFEWFEVARTELLRKIGIPYSKVEELGVSMPLLEAGCKFFKPSFYDNELTVEAKIDEMPKATILINYSIFHEENLLTTGFTKHAFVNSQLKPLRLPSFLKEIFETYFPKREG